MKTDFTPTVCIYHHNCADGFAAAWAIWKRWPMVEMVPGIYGQPVANLVNENIIMVDFSYKTEDMQCLLDAGNRILVLDHHKSAEKELEPFFAAGQIEGVFDMDKSGAVLAWEFAHPDVEIPTLLRHIQDRDLWKFELPNTKFIQSALFSYEYDMRVWDRMLSADDHEIIPTLVREGAAIHRKHMKDIHELIPATLRSMNIGGHTVPVCNLPYTMASDAANIMCDMDFDFLGGKPVFAACYYDTPGQRKFSLRSTNGFDVSEVAALHGGGGHAAAAGFVVPQGWQGDAVVKAPAA